MPQYGRRNCDTGHEGVDVRESAIRWIILSIALVAWVSTALAARAELTMHWFLAIWLATGVASCGVLIIVKDLMARARETRQAEAGRASLDQATQRLCAAIGEHATRMEKATKGHGERLRSDVFTHERLITNKWRGIALAQLDAAREASERGSDTGPLPIISSSPQ